MNKLEYLIEKQKQFQRAVNYPIDSIVERDRNWMAENYAFKAIEEIVELRKEFPSVANPDSKNQKDGNIQRIKEEFADVLLFLINMSIVWKISPEEMLKQLLETQSNNFNHLKKKRLEQLKTDILKVPDVVSGVGQGNINPKYIFVGQNPSKKITHGYEFWSNEKDGSSKILLPILDELNIRDECYFTNLVKCTTVDNSEPNDEMTEFYLEFFKKELEILMTGLDHNVIIIAMGKWTDSKIPKEIPHYYIQHPTMANHNFISKEEYTNHVKETFAHLN